MEAVTERKKRYRTHFNKREIPKQFIYELYDGKPMYYRGYKDVLNQLKTTEEIMGASSLQGLIIAAILRYLYKNLDDKYLIVTNEIGLHIDKNSNLASDIAIYDRATFLNSTIDEHYVKIPPLVVFEVDVEADFVDFGISGFDYYSLKTRKLLDFGVKEVYWFASMTEQLLIAQPQGDWTMSNWGKEIYLLGEYKFSLSDLLKSEGYWKKSS